MKRNLFCILGSLILVVTFATVGLAGIQVYFKRLSPSTIKVKILDPRSGMITRNISAHDGTPLGGDQWFHSAPVSKMLINVPDNVIDPNPEVNCSISY